MIARRGDLDQGELIPVKFSPQTSVGPEKEAAAPDKGEVTQWLIAGSDGDAHALESLLPLVYE